MLSPQRIARLAGLSAAVLAMTVSLQTVAAPTKAEESTDAAKPVRQTKMGTCSKDAKAKGLKGDERKAYMSDCLKSKPAKSAA
jgi:hypothetical protein